MATRTSKPAKSPQMDTTLASTFAGGRAIPLKAVEPEVKKTKKQKMVRDSFTIPKAEFQVIEVLKARCAALGLSIKKSELLRAGIKLLHDLEDAALHKAATNVPTIKTGRPSKVETGDTTAAKPLKVKTPKVPEDAAQKSAAQRASTPATVKAPVKATSVPKAVTVKKPVKTVAAEAKPTTAQKAAKPQTTATPMVPLKVTAKARPARRPATQLASHPSAEAPSASVPQAAPTAETPAV